MAKKKTNVAEKVEMDITPEVVNPAELAIPALQEYYAKEVETFKAKVQELNDEESLKKLEEDLMKEFDEYDKVISDRSYKLPEEVSFNSRRLTKESVGRMIGRLLDKMEVEYRMTLGLWQLYRWWQTPKTEIGYGAYDSTVRILGTLKYKGPQEWEFCLAIVEFLKECNEQYTRDQLWQDYLAQKHNEILNRMDLVSGHTAAADALEGLPYNPTEANMPQELKEQKEQK